MLSRFYSHVHEFGVWDTTERLLCKMTHHFLRSGFRKRDIPSLAELAASASSVHMTPDGLISTLTCASADDLRRLRIEYEGYRSKLVQQYQDVALEYAPEFAIEEGSGFLLYALVRALRPSVVLETGVANGHSSMLVLGALTENGSGELHSVDVSENVGKLVIDRRRWNLHRLQASDLKRSFAKIVAQLPTIALMIHDSDHSCQWMRHELESVYPRMSPDGILACDDANICYGLMDFSAAHGVKPLLLMEKRKVFGVISLAAQSVLGRYPGGNGNLVEAPSFTAAH